MRIALVHSFYRSGLPSGENHAVLTLREALAGAGHEVEIIRRSSDDIGPMRTLGAAATVVSGAGPSPLKALRAFQPDVVHVHNLFPNYGQQWARSWRGPLVVTLHNFRTLCARGTLHRSGQQCTLCPDGSRWASVRHKCYRDSALATLPWAASPLHGPRDPVLQRASRVITLSERAHAMFVRYGLDERRLVVLPNAVAPVGAPRAAAAPRKWLVLGRLDPGKGLRELFAEWPTDEHLDVVGEGPLGPELRRLCPPNVVILGLRDRRWIAENLPSYAGLIFPSALLENSPLSVLEALSCGVPVVARMGSAGADLIAAIEPDWVYAPQGIRSALQRVVVAGATGRVKALDGYLANHTLGAWVQRHEAVYTQSLRSSPR